MTRLGALLGTAVSAQTAAAFLAGCSAPEAGYRPRTLTPAQFDLLGALAETILPATDTPGAREAGVPGFVDTLLTEFYPEAETAAFLEGISAFEAAFDPVGRFLAASGAEQETALADWDAEVFRRPPAVRVEGEAFDAMGFYRRFKELVVVGYYTSEAGATLELRANPMGSYQADVPLNEVGRSYA